MIKNIRAAECDIDGSKVAIDITDGKILERHIEDGYKGGYVRADMKVTLTFENCMFFVTNMLEDDPNDIGTLDDFVHSIIHNIIIFTDDNIDIIEKNEYDKE